VLRGDELVAVDDDHDLVIGERGRRADAGEVVAGRVHPGEAQQVGGGLVVVVGAERLAVDGEADELTGAEALVVLEVDDLVVLDLLLDAVSVME
jgi:hypothetical protein